jgi:hypothetical protein
MTDQAALTESQQAFMRSLSELNDGDHWRLFVNAGFTMADALHLQTVGLIEIGTQMGMPAARLAGQGPSDEEIAKRMEQTFEVTGDKWFKLAANALRREPRSLGEEVDEK